MLTKAAFIWSEYSKKLYYLEVLLQFKNKWFLFE